MKNFTVSTLCHTWVMVLLVGLKSEENTTDMKTANILVYGNFAVYMRYFAVCLKVDYTLKCLEYICSVSSLLRRHRVSLCSHS